MQKVSPVRPFGAPGQGWHVANPVTLAKVRCEQR